MFPLYLKEMEYRFKHRRDNMLHLFLFFFAAVGFLALRKAQSPNADGRCPEANTPQNDKSCDWWDILNFARNFFERN
jgi:hypothetical protein